MRTDLFITEIPDVPGFFRPDFSNDEFEER
jgi:hypothetical protein